VGSTFRNPDLAVTYSLLGARGTNWLYDGSLAGEIVQAVTHPPLVSGSTYNARPGLMQASDLAAYEALSREPTHARYRGFDVYGMAPSSSGGSTVGEALQILGNVELSGLSRTQALHYYAEASARAYADRGAYVGDPADVNVPLGELLSPGFARERFCTIDPLHATTKPVPAGAPDGSYTDPCATPAGAVTASHEGLSTTNLTVADRWGNVVEYTLTIEQTGGSGILVPGRGFLLNNELTDFNFTPAVPNDPNLPAPGKRPRSSMSPTVLLQGGHPYLAVGSPGGASIITTVLQILIDRLDLGLTLPQAIADARVSSRNSAAGLQREPAFDPAGLAALGHVFAPNPVEIGAATGIEFRPNGTTLAAAEPVRRGGGSAAVVTPSP
jgi:gamma-glutamyltranspeptidase/glutathione hydrolase